MINLNEVTIGSDPEYAAIDRYSLLPKSVVKFLPGTKKKPFDLNEYVSCQVDNVGAECCIPPCRTEDEFIEYMTMAKILTEKKLQEKAPSLMLASLSSARYAEKELNSPTARMFGCEPSYCVYTKNVSPRPSPEEVGSLRSFGFHIHIGFKVADGENQFQYVDRIIKAMDIMLGLPSIAIDTDTDRRSIYGNAGDLRFRRIEDLLIVEYRTLGGAMHDGEDRLRFVFRQTMKAVELVNNWSDVYDDLSFDIESAINSGATEHCLELFEKLTGIVIPESVYKTTTVPC